MNHSSNCFFNSYNFMCGVMNTDEVYGFLDLYEEIEAL